MAKFPFALLLIACFFFSLTAQVDDQKEPAKLKTIADFTAGLQKIEGYLPLYYDDGSGRMYIEIERPGREFLYQVSLATGVGSNPIGLDRGQLGDTRVVRFERIGRKVLLVQPNYGYRALSENPAERRAVEESFARSVIWGFPVAAAENERLLVRADDFFIRDAHGAGRRLERARQGDYSLDKSRSAFYLPGTRGFVKNTEVETIITLIARGETGRLVGQTAPEGAAVTVRQRHSFVELPDGDYRPREFDPRVGAFAIRFYDYATGINENLEKRWIVRHRLEKKDPGEAFGEAKEPIIYYVDNGAPPAVRDALVEGARWWNQAFEAAGYKNAFQVRVLPADADPLDIRYNVIYWVHRSTRGWAYGRSVVDPRTGEIIRGVVTLDSQRARQDYLIGSGFAAQYADAAGEISCGMLMPDAGYLTDSKTDAYRMSLARIRQLSAHEIGHTLGFSHNFAASTYGGRASVMDYPAPLIKITGGELDFSEAYATGIGLYDQWATRFAYTDFPAGTDDEAALEKILREGEERGYLFISDADARPAGAAHPLANLWDNGSDPIAELKHIMRVRKIGIERFGLNNAEPGMPLSELENKFLPLYLHHRYQTAAAVKTLGGAFYNYSVRKADQATPAPVYQIVPPARQREALAAVLGTLDHRELAIPDKILQLIPPQAYGYNSERSETFPKRTDPVFDPLGAAEIAAGMTIDGLLEPNRAARLIAFNARDKNNPHFREAVDALVGATWKTPVSQNDYHAEIRRTVQTVAVNKLIDLAADENVQMQVRAVASGALRDLYEYLKVQRTAGKTRDHHRQTMEDIRRFLDRPDNPYKQTRPLPEPPGDPIG